MLPLPARVPSGSSAIWPETYTKLPVLIPWHIAKLSSHFQPGSISTKFFITFSYFDQDDSCSANQRLCFGFSNRARMNCAWLLSPGINRRQERRSAADRYRKKV